MGGLARVVTKTLRREEAGGRPLAGGPPADLTIEGLNSVSEIRLSGQAPSSTATDE